MNGSLHFNMSVKTISETKTEIFNIQLNKKKTYTKDTPAKIGKLRLGANHTTPIQ